MIFGHAHGGDEINKVAGGGGNVYKPTEEELAANKAENEKLRSSSFNKDRGGLKGLADKAKDMFKSGNKE